MRISALWGAISVFIIGYAAPALGQVDQQRAQQYFKEAAVLCEHDGGRLWGLSLCAPMVIGDARTQTFATSQPPPDTPRPRLIGILNGPIKWGDTMWAALTWDQVSSETFGVRHENSFIHESFHIAQRQLGHIVDAEAPEHLDSMEGRYWLRLEWRALARALRGSGEARGAAVCGGPGVPEGPPPGLSHGGVKEGAP